LEINTRANIYSPYIEESMEQESIQQSELMQERSTTLQEQEDTRFRDTSRSGQERFSLSVIYKASLVQSLSGMPESEMKILKDEVYNSEQLQIHIFLRGYAIASALSGTEDQQDIIPIMKDIALTSDAYVLSKLFDIIEGTGEIIDENVTEVVYTLQEG